MGRFLDAMNGNPSSAGNNSTGGRFLKAMQLSEDIAATNKKNTVVVTPPQTKPNIFQQAWNGITSFVKKPYEGRINKLINENKINLEEEKQKQQPDPGAIRQYETAVGDLTKAQNSGNFFERYGTSAKYKIKQDAKATAGDIVGMAKSMMDSVGSLFEKKIYDEQQFIKQQEDSINRVMDEQKIPEDQREQYVRKYSPRYQQSPVNGVHKGKSYDEFMQENKKLYENGREPFEKTLDRFIEDTKIHDPSFMDQLRSGITSMVSFMAASYLTGGGSVTAGTMEAMQEMGNVWDTNKHNGMSIPDNWDGASKDFAGNIVWNILIDRFEGIFDKMDTGQILSTKKKVFEVIKNMSAEAIQEMGQQLMSNAATKNKDPFEGVALSGILGGLIGGGATGISVATGGEDTGVAQTTTKTNPSANIEDKGGNANIEEKKPENKWKVDWGHDTSMDKRELRKAGFGEEASGFEETATVFKIDGKPAVALHWMDNSLDGFSVAEEFRNKGVATDVLRQVAEMQGGKLSVEAPNKQMVSILNKLGTVEVNEGTGTHTLTLKEPTKGFAVETPVQEVTKKKGVVARKLTKQQQTNQDIKQRVGERSVKFREETRPLAERPFIKRLISMPFAERMLGDRYKDILKIAEITPTTRGEGHLLNSLNGLLMSMGSREGINPTPSADITNKADKVIREYQRLNTRKSDASVVKTVTSAEIVNYMGNKSSKFREESGKTDQMILDQKNREVTTKFLEHPDIKGKEYLGRMYIQNLAKGMSLKAYERSVIDEVLNKDFAGQEKIKGADFRRAVQARMMPLDIILSDTYATYGLDNIGVDNLANDEYEGTAKTYILNSPFDHGKTGHFSSDYSNTRNKAADFEIKEIPAQEGNPTAKYAVVKTGVELTRENIAQNVLTVENSREQAQSWIDSHTEAVASFNENSVINDTVNYLKKIKGLFGHFRAFDGGNTSSVVEVQSDAFQHGVGTTQNIKTLEGDIAYTKETIADYEKDIANVEENIKNYKEDYKKLKQESDKFELQRAESNLAYMKERLLARQMALTEYQNRLEALNKSGVTKDEAVFQTYKNIWQERIVREAINIKAKEGFKFLRFPTPRTVAVVEGFTGGEDGNTMPYEITSGDENHLEVGDTINYGGEDMTVVSADAYGITVAPSDKVESFNIYSYIDDQANARWDDIAYYFRSIPEEFGFEIKTAADAANALEINMIAKKYSEYQQKDREIKDIRDRLKTNNDVEFLAEQEKKLDELNRFLELIKSGVIEKEGITFQKMENFRRGTVDGNGNAIIEPGMLDSTRFFSPEGLGKYGFGTGVWEKLKYSIRSDDAKSSAISNFEYDIKRTQETVDAAKIRVDFITDIANKQIQEISAREMPSKEDLAKLPENIKDRAEKSTYPYSPLEYEVEVILQDFVDNNEEGAEFDLDQISEDWTAKYIENFDAWDDLSGMYGNDNVFQDGDMAWVVTEGNTEQFSQPSEYDQTSSVEDFSIDNFDNEQKTVLEFYEKQLIPYLKKLRAGNLELVTDDNGYQWWETKLTDTDKLPPTAYRVKEDLASVGVEITEAEEKEILKLNRKWFGDSSVKITEQILANKNALGSYSEAMIKILNGKGNYKDTFYHEAVHKYIDVFLTTKEQVDLFNAGIKKYRTTDLATVEERLAEDFIKYAKDRSSLRGKIRAIFDKIMLRVQSYMDNADSIEKLYNDIVTGEAAKARKAATPDKSQAPVGKGEVKESALYKRTKEQLLMHNPQFYGYSEETGTYNELSLATDAERAVNYLERNPKDSIRIGLGLSDAPAGQTATGISLAAAIKARSEGNYGLYTDIMNSLSLRLTRMGQEIVSVRGTVNDDSPENYIRQAIDGRMEKLGDRMLSIANENVKRTAAKKKAVEKIKKETVKLQEKLSSEQVKVRKAQDIIDALRC